MCTIGVLGNFILLWFPLAIKSFYIKKCYTRILSSAIWTIKKNLKLLVFFDPKAINRYFSKIEINEIVLNEIKKLIE